MLTPEQKRFFETFGYLVFRQALSAREVAEISAQFDDLMAEARNGEPFGRKERQVVMEYIEKRPALTRLLEDDRVFAVMEDLLGPGFVWLPSDGNVYVGNTDWHPDRREILPCYTVIKMAMYLDPVRKDSGCLRVVPGSHREPLHSDLLPLFQHRATPPAHPFGVTSERLPAVPLESDPGDVVLFSQHLWHASFGGSDHRRMFTLNFTTKPTEEAHVADHRRNYESALKWAQTNPYGPQDHVYDPTFLAGGGPRRQAMLKQIVEWGFR